MDHGFTYQCHPPSLAAGLAVQKHLESHHLIERAHSMGTVLGERLARFQELPGVGDVRGLGMLWTVEFVRDKESRKPWEQEKKVSERIFTLARSEGVLVYPMRGAAGEGLGDHVLIAPPFIISREDVSFLLQALETAVRKAV
jgi:hypothetical protein